MTLELWADPENDAAASCCSADAVRLARSVAHRMGMPHLTLDLRPEFRAGVVEPFLAGYAAGETPNPCVGCNGHVRLDAMLDLADRLGAPDLATGHYARVTDDGLLRVAADPAKDQTYMLSALAPASLARMRFPLAELTKPEVRALAAEAELPVASRAESQDLCFLAGTGQGALPRSATRASRTRPGRSSRPRARSSARIRASTTSPSASARASAWPRPSRSTCCAPRPRRTASSSARATSWPSTGSPCAARACTVPAARSTPSGCATTRAQSPAAWPENPVRAPIASSSWNSRNPSTERPQGSPRACFAAT